MQFSERWHRSKKHWNILTYYQRFESAIAFVLTMVIALIILVALYRHQASEHHPDEGRRPDSPAGGGAQVHHSRHTRRDHRLSARTGGNYPGTRGNLSAHARA